jgi:hypothetical protein
MEPYDLPEEFAHLQAQDMGKIGFINDLVRGIKKVIVKTKPEQKTTISTHAPAVSGNIANLLKRAYMFVGEGDFDSADDYAEKVLNIDSECAEAYVVKLMCNLKVKKKYEIPNSTKAFNNNSNYLKAMRFGDENLIKKLKLYKIDYAITEKEKSINERKATIDRLNNEINKFDKENDCINKKYKKAVVGAIAHMICTFLLVILVFSFRFPSLFSFSYLLIGTDLYYFVLISTMLASIVIKIVGINAMLKNSFTRVYKHAAIKSLREEIAVIENLNENAYKTAEAV